MNSTAVFVPGSLTLVPGTLPPGADASNTNPSGGTNGAGLIDVRNLNLTGKKAEALLDEVGVTVNKNAIPFDPEKPFVTSGLRLGTPAVTTRGFDEEAMVEIAKIMGLTLKNPEDKTVHDEARQRVSALCEKFPLYDGLHN